MQHPFKAAAGIAVQQPFKKSLTTEKTTNAAWRSKPTFCAVPTNDRTINPDLDRFTGEWVPRRSKSRRATSR